MTKKPRDNGAVRQGGLCFYPPFVSTVKKRGRRGSDCQSAARVRGQAGGTG